MPKATKIENGMGRLTIQRVVPSEPAMVRLTLELPDLPTPGNWKVSPGGARAIAALLIEAAGDAEWAEQETRKE